MSPWCATFRTHPEGSVAAPESTLVDELETVTNRRDLPTLVEHLSTVSADVIRGGGVLASMANRHRVVMYGTDEPGTLGTLNPILLRAGEGLGGVTIWRW